MISRRTLLAGAIAAAPLAAVTRAGLARGADGIRWFDPRAWGVEGRGWSQTERFFDRLPLKAQGRVPRAVWDLSRHSAGISFEFETDAPVIHAKYRLLHAGLAMPHMPATGVSGLDLYAMDGARWKWAAVFKPGAQECDGVLAQDLEPVKRRYRVYLPLYNGVESIEVGVPEGSAFEGITPRAERPVLFYGTSILHGACASRPGMAWPSIVGRKLGVPIINLGFSGSGKMEAEVAALLAEVDASAFVIDCAPNMNARQITERTAPLVGHIRAARPDAPIVLIEDRRYGFAWVSPKSNAKNEQNAVALAGAYADLTARGVKNLAYIPAGVLLGDEPEEAMTDGSHPSDLGMSLYAKAVLPVLAGAMGRLVPC